MWLQPWPAPPAPHCVALRLVCRDAVENADKYFRPFQAACDTANPRIRATALDCVQKLIGALCACNGGLPLPSRWLVRLPSPAPSAHALIVRPPAPHSVPYIGQQSISLQSLGRLWWSLCAVPGCFLGCLGFNSVVLGCVGVPIPLSFPRPLAGPAYPRRVHHPLLPHPAVCHKSISCRPGPLVFGHGREGVGGSPLGCLCFAGR